MSEESFEMRQFCRLGEMIGDGLHNEPDGRWISKEYARLSKLLFPKTKEEKEFTAKVRKSKNEALDIKMKELLASKECKCGGSIKQSRSGSLVAYCEKCKARYSAKYKKT
jgi:hypothetical protein